MPVVKTAYPWYIWIMKSELLNIRPLVLDGAMGTMLQARGLPAGAAPDLWNMEPVSYTHLTLPTTTRV